MKYLKLGGLNNRTAFSHSPEARTHLSSKIKMLAELVSSETMSGSLFHASRLAFADLLAIHDVPWLLDTSP